MRKNSLVNQPRECEGVLFKVLEKTPLKRTPLYPEQRKKGATFVSFSGWEMPLHYGSQLKEHQRVRDAVGVFDVSHMLVIDIKGKESTAFLRFLLANDVQKLKGSGSGLYTCILNQDAGIVDDLIVYKLSDQHYRAVVNAGTRDTDVTWFMQHAAAYTVTITPRQDLALLALQGPKTFEQVDPLFLPWQSEAIHALKPFHCVLQDDWFVARTGYTGEKGIEIVLPNQAAQSLWQSMMQLDIQPVGLGARDTLRLEAGLNLYGADMGVTFTPDESNVAWTVDLGDPDRSFLGKAALLEKRSRGVQQKLIGLALQPPGVARASMRVYDATGTVLKGHVTSGGFSPTLGAGIALARVKNEVCSHYHVDIRGKLHLAKVVKLPFLREGKPTFLLAN